MKLVKTLSLERCPHCRIALPAINLEHVFESNSPQGGKKFWRTYTCSSCGGLVAGYSGPNNEEAIQIIPATSEPTVDPAVPEKPREYLRQAMQSAAAPAGAVMLAASCVDAMLKDKGFETGSLYARIDEAKDAHLITAEMARWAHQIRLDANDQRHVDVNSGLPTNADAERCIDFALALAQFIYVLPARVTRGLAASAPATTPSKAP